MVEKVQVPVVSWDALLADAIVPAESSAVRVMRDVVGGDGMPAWPMMPPAVVEDMVRARGMKRASARTIASLVRRAALRLAYGEEAAGPRPASFVRLAREAELRRLGEASSPDLDASPGPVEVLVDSESGVFFPRYMTSGAAGADLVSAASVSLHHGETARICLGVEVAIPVGYEGQIRPRSSAAARGLIVHTGTIDSDYRGQLSAVVTNAGTVKVTIDRGDRIAQLIIAPVVRAQFVAGRGEPTARGEGGFGSTGAK